MKKTLFLTLMSFIVAGFMACSSDNSKTSSVEVRLTDAPGDYQEVNIDIQGVEVNSSESNSGWKSLEIKKGVYNILKLTNGLDTILGKIDLPAGKISQIRLVLGANNSIKTGGLVYNLNTPSAQQSGLKLLINTNIQAGVTYKILLDFDAARSIVSTGVLGKFNLKPVIRTITEATSGAIKGTITPLTATPAVYAISGTDTVGTAFADQATGKFLIKGLAVGSYKVSFQPKEGFQVLTKESVGVTVGSVTDLGTVTIIQ